MHINWRRGETRAFVWRKRDNVHWNRSYGKDWREASVSYKWCKATCDLEEPRHKKKSRPKLFRGPAGSEWFFNRNFETERARDEAKERHRYRVKWSWWERRMREARRRLERGEL